MRFVVFVFLLQVSHYAAGQAWRLETAERIDGTAYALAANTVDGESLDEARVDFLCQPNDYALEFQIFPRDSALLRMREVSLRLQKPIDARIRIGNAAPEETGFLVGETSTGVRYLFYAIDFEDALFDHLKTAPVLVVQITVDDKSATYAWSLAGFAAAHGRLAEHCRPQPELGPELRPSPAP